MGGIRGGTLELFRGNISHLTSSILLHCGRGSRYGFLTQGRQMNTFVCGWALTYQHNVDRLPQETPAIMWPLEPIPLVPVRTIPVARLVYRTILADESATDQVADSQPRRVLEGDSVAYAMDGIIATQPSGVIIVMASPLTSGPSPRVKVRSGDRVVIKAVPYLNNVNCINDPFGEIAAYQLLQRRHCNVIHMIHCLRDNRYIYMVLPFLSGGDLFSKLEDTNGGLSEAETITYFRQMCDGLLFMKRTCGLAHHDISLENAMLDEQGHVKIIDLGMCFRVPVSTSSGPSNPIYLTSQRCKGKPMYVAPEVVNEEPCDPFASDIWSLGICLYTMLTGRPLYSSPRDTTFRIMAQGGARNVIDDYEQYGLILPPMAKDLVCRMLHSDPQTRPRLEDILQSSYLLSKQ